jgi:opine dehydrogenase
MTLLEGDEAKTGTIGCVTYDFEKIRCNDVVLITIQSNFHEPLIKRLVPYLDRNQIVIFNPGYFATAYMLKHAKDKLFTIVEATSSFIDGRISKPGEFKVGFRNVRNPMGVYPSCKTPFVKDKLANLGYSLYYYSSVIEAALHNPNLIVHTVGAVMSIPRIEKTNGNYVMYHEVFTPSVWNILEKLDSEKMDVMDKLGFKRVPYVEACKFRNTLDDRRNAKEVFFWYASMPTRAIGPIAVDTRYINEDVPQGLVMLEALGHALNISTPVCTALIEIASAAVGRDFRLEGRTLESLGKENVDTIIREALTE